MADEGRDALIQEISERAGRDLATKTVLFHHHLAAKLGLSVTDLKCLDLLSSAEVPLTAKNLADLMGLTGGAITGVVDRLEAAGFVERVRDPDDRRRWELRRLPGRDRDVMALFAPLTAAMVELAGEYDDAQLATISDFLDRLGGILDARIEDLRS